MPYRKLEFEPGHFYHIYNRGNNREQIFFESENYLFFLRRMRELHFTDCATVVAYCLMPNHYHYLIQIKTSGFAALMQRLLLSYCKAINKRFGRTGALFQGRFQAIEVDRDEYLIHLSRYIHVNPVRANLVARAEDWAFSSYREYIGLRNGTLPDPTAVLSHFATREDYRRFVEAEGDQDIKLIGHLTLE